MLGIDTWSSCPGKARILAVVALAASGVAACAEGPDPAFVSVRDSAGVKIVENRGEGDRPATGWVVSDAPTLRIGTRDGMPAEQFTAIGGATRLSDGTIVVLEESVSEVRFFDSNGTHLATRGGLGEGPGEFRYARGLVRGPADSIYVHAAATRGLTVFTSEGDFARVDIPDFAELWSRFEANPSCRAMPLFADGTFLSCAVAPELPTLESRVETGLRPRTGFRIVRLHRDTARADMLGLWLGSQAFHIVEGPWRTARSHVFFPTSHLAVGADPMRLYLARNPAYDIEVWDPDGKLLRRIRRLDARLAPTEDERAEGWQVLTGTMDEPFMSGALVRRILADFPVPDSVPAVAGLTSGPNGELWVKRGPVLPSTTTSRFDVFDDGGVYLGEVTLGLPVELLEVGDDHLLAVFKDEYDIPYLLMYHLDRPGR
jgi:hypothetical protein